MFFYDEEGVHFAQFGNGDIVIAPGLLDVTDEDIGSVALIEQEPHEIGLPYDKIPEECVLDNMLPDPCRIRLTFTNTKSIDVLIEQLQECKRFMESGCVDIGKQNDNIK